MRGLKAPRTLRMVGAAAMLAATVTGLEARAEAEDAPLVLAEAEDQPSTVDPVTVTAKRLNEHPYADPDAPYKTDRSASGKFTEPLLDTPKSVTVISEQAIKDSGALTFRDLMRTQPGVTLGTGEGGNAFGDRIFIRGFDARNDVYVDGVRDPGVGSRETFAVEQVEILKGPSSAFGGRGTTGGAVSVVSKQPQDGNFGDAEITLGTDDTRRAQIDFNRQLTDRVAVRLNAVAHESGVAGRDHVFNNRWGVAAAIRFEANDRLTLSADYFHLSTDELPDWGVPYDVANNRPFEVRRENFYGVLDRDFRETFSDIYTAGARFQATDALTLRTVLRYGQSKNAYTASAPEQPNPALRTVRANAKRRDAVTDYLVNQSDLTARFRTGGAEHALVAGYELSRETVLNRQRSFTECAVLPCTGLSSNPVLNLDRPDATIPRAVVDNGVLSRSEIEVTNAAAYILDTIRFGPRWELFGGLRFDRYDIAFQQLTLATGAVALRGQEESFVNGHAGLVYKPSPNTSLYASYASSSNPSGEQLDSVALDYGGLDPRTVDLKPEHNRALELGAKAALFDDDLLLTAALFRVDKTNARVVIPGGAVALAGERRVQGFEFTASGNLGPRTGVFGGITVLEAETVDSPVASQIGAAFPNISEVSASLTARHQLTGRAHLGGTVSYNSEKSGGELVAVSTRIPGWTRLDLFAGYKLTDRLEIGLAAQNVTDELYYDALYRSATPFTYVAPGRSLRLTLDYDF